MGNVIKRNGKKQLFSPLKIKNSIQGAAKEAKLSTSKTKELLESVADPVIKLFKGISTVKSTVIRRSIIRRLDRRTKSVSHAWKKFDKKKKK